MSIPTGVAFARALEKAGVISDLDSITRVVIDIQPDDTARVYVERIGDSRLLEAFKGPLGMMLAEHALPGHAPGCDLRFAHQVPEGCPHVHPASEGLVGM